jgi:hypothetical protein
MERNPVLHGDELVRRFAGSGKHGLFLQARFEESIFSKMFTVPV